MSYLRCLRRAMTVVQEKRGLSSDYTKGDVNEPGPFFQ